MTDPEQQAKWDALSLADRARAYAKAYRITGTSAHAKRLIVFFDEVADALDSNAARTLRSLVGALVKVAPDETAALHAKLLERMAAHDQADAALDDLLKVLRET